MKSDQLKASALRWVIDIWNKGDFAYFDQLASERYTYEAPGLGPINAQQLREHVFGRELRYPMIVASAESARRAAILAERIKRLENSQS